MLGFEVISFLFGQVKCGEKNEKLFTPIRRVLIPLCKSEQSTTRLLIEFQSFHFDVI